MGKVPSRTSTFQADLTRVQRHKNGNELIRTKNRNPTRRSEVLRNHDSSAFGPLPSSSAFGPLPSSRTSSSLFVVQHVDFHSSRKARACRGAYGLVGPSRTSAGVSAPNRSRLRSTNGLSCRLLVQKMLRHPHGTMPLPREWWLARVGGCLHPEPRGTSPHSSWGLRDPKVPWTSCPTL